MKALKWLVVPALPALAVGVAACGGGGSSGGGGELAGEIRIDGSSTVAPISEPIGALFSDENSDTSVTVGTAGTGGGFERFCAGETDISDASRPIEPEEAQLCEENGVEYEEIVVANDALSVVVNPDNPVTCMSPDQLSEIYGEDADITSWSDVGDLDAPYDEDLEIFSPGADSGTFDYFTDAVNGEEGVQRSDGVQTSADDNVIVTGVSGEEGGLGYAGFSFYEQNQDKLSAVSVDGGSGCVEPTSETIQSGEYKPLSRPIFMYPATKALERPEVKAFLEFAIENHQKISEAANIVPMSDEQATESETKVSG